MTIMEMTIRMSRQELLIETDMEMEMIRLMTHIRMEWIPERMATEDMIIREKTDLTSMRRMTTVF